LPHGIALDSRGQLLTIEFATRRLASIDPSNGKIVEIAGNLPIGMHGPRPELGAGLTVGASGAIYLSSDVENSLYKLTKQ
jgi:hypothetical protein